MTVNELITELSAQTRPVMHKKIWIASRHDDWEVLSVYSDVENVYIDIQEIRRKK